MAPDLCRGARHAGEGDATCPKDTAWDRPEAQEPAPAGKPFSRRFRAPALPGRPQPALGKKGSRARAWVWGAGGRFAGWNLGRGESPSETDRREAGKGAGGERKREAGAKRRRRRKEQEKGGGDGRRTGEGGKREGSLPGVPISHSYLPFI